MSKVSFIKGDPMPDSVGICADHLKAVEEVRLAMQREVDIVKARETEIREHIIETLDASDDTGASGNKYKAQIKIGEAASVADWEEVYDFVAENDRFDLLGKSVQQKAVKAMWAEGVKVPGIEKINTKKVSITKI
tara:strand:+ start:38331 stop:38735 length:405 start_codon:yes stop_codon:yes gene_type:complete